MDVHIESYETAGDDAFNVMFCDSGGRKLIVLYTHCPTVWGNGNWQMDFELLEAAIHELRRLNGTLPVRRVGGTWPAKGGE